MDASNLRIFAPDHSKYFAQKVCDYLNEKYRLDIVLGLCDDKMFSDGEFRPTLGKSVRNKDVYIISCVQNTAFDTSINDKIMQSLFFVNAAATSSPERVTLVWPYYPYARQDRKAGRQPRSARMIADIVQAAGADALVTCDIHSQQIENAFPSKGFGYDNLKASRRIIPYVQENFASFLENSVVCSPDAGGASRAKYFATAFNKPLTIFSKLRDAGSNIDHYQVSDDVEGKNLIIVDDIIGTCSTTKKAVVSAREKGALDMLILVVHPLLNFNEKENKPAEETLRDLKNYGVKAVVATDSILHSQEFYKRNEDILRIISIADIHGEAIYRLHFNESLEELVD